MTQIVPIQGMFGTEGMFDPSRDHGDAAAAAARRRRRRIVVRPPVVAPPVVQPRPKPKAPVMSQASPNSPYQMMSDAEIQKKADELVQSSLQSQADPIIRARQEAANRAMGTQAATIGFTKAAQEMLAGLGGPIGADYADAQAKMSGLGLSADAQPFADYQAEALQREGDAGTTWAGQLGQIEGNLGQQQLGGLMYQSEQEQKDYEQQLIDLAHQRPELRGQILDRLYQNELTKQQIKQNATKEQTDEADRRTQATGLLYVVGKDGKPVLFHGADGKPVPTVQGRAETAQEAALGLDSQKQAWSQQMDLAGLKYKYAHDAAANDAKVKAAQAKGQMPDSDLSAKYGYIVDGNGNAITGPDGAHIPVAKTTKPPAAGRAPFQLAIKEARTIAGKPALYQGSKVITVKATKPSLNADGTMNPGSPAKSVRIKGKYVASPDAKGVYSTPDPNNPGHYIRTTNDPKKAQRPAQYTYPEAITYLVDLYGITPQQAKRALRAAGWIAPKAA